MSVLFFLVPPVLDFLLSSPAATHGMGRMLQGIDGTVPLPNTTISPTCWPFDYYPFNGTHPGPCCWPFDHYPFNGTHPGPCSKVKGNGKIITVIILGVVKGVSEIIVICILAAFYKQNVTDRRRGFPSSVPPQYSLKKDNFPFGTFSCEDAETCGFGWFCQPCRLGDTMAQVGASSYWKMVTAYIVCVPLGIMLGSVSGAVLFLALGFKPLFDHTLFVLVTGMSFLIALSFFIGLCILLAHERKKLRRNLGGKGTGNFCMDFCCYFWCLCCAITQDARTVDGAADTAVKCPCRLVRLNMVDAVGEPVSVSEEESTTASESD